MQLAATLKTIEELDFGDYQKQKLYRRVVALEEARLINPRRGAANTILLDPHEISILRKLISLEDTCRRTKTAVEKLKFQLALEENEALKAQLTKQEQDMQEKLRQRDRQIQSLNALVLRKSWWGRFWQKLTSLLPRKQGVKGTESAT